MANAPAATIRREEKCFFFRTKNPFWPVFTIYIIRSVVVDTNYCYLFISTHKLKSNRIHFSLSLALSACFWFRFLVICTVELMCVGSWQRVQTDSNFGRRISCKTFYTLNRVDCCRRCWSAMVDGNARAIASCPTRKTFFELKIIIAAWHRNGYFQYFRFLVALASSTCFAMRPSAPSKLWFCSFRYVSSQVLSTTFGRFTFSQNKNKKKKCKNKNPRDRNQSPSILWRRQWPISLLFFRFESIDFFNSFQKLWIVSHSWSLQSDVGSWAGRDDRHAHAQLNYEAMLSPKHRCHKIWININRLNIF